LHAGIQFKIVDDDDRLTQAVVNVVIEDQAENTIGRENVENTI
jgi:hypothetical protein